jgi:hypothetical protein
MSASHHRDVDPCPSGLVSDVLVGNDSASIARTCELVDAVVELVLRGRDDEPPAQRQPVEHEDDLPRGSVGRSQVLISRERSACW